MTDDEQWEKEGAPLFKEAREQAAAEPVPPAALARTRAALRERLGDGPRVVPWLALATAMLATVAFVVWRNADYSPRDVVTGDAPTSFALADDASVDVGTHSRITLAAPREVVLAKGSVKLRTLKPLKVRAGAVTLEAASTTFEVAFDGDQVRFMVSEGVVRASRGSESWEVKAGEQWPAPVVLAPAAPQPERVPEAKNPEALSKLEQAAVLTQQGRLDAARAIYARLAKEEASIAELALYHLARLEAQRAHRPKQALDALDELLRRFPDGALAREAKLSRIEALRALGRTADADAAAQQLPADAGR